jgi:lysophospholipase L1-like esterase
MEFRTQVTIDTPPFLIEPCEEILFVGSCFADAIGQRFRDEAFPVTVNPYGVMYNPASILHTLQRIAAGVPAAAPRVAFLTLGTNHVYRLKSTGEIVDNCQKRPAALFQEEMLSVDQCADYLRQSVTLLQELNPNIHVVFTVSPIRYRKYGYHESQLSKATLLLAINKLIAATSPAASVAPAASGLPAGVPGYSTISYFPAYELVMDELRDYRFYASDMLHPSAQAVDFIWERLVDSYFSPAAKNYLAEWLPLKRALTHRPFQPDSDDYRTFLAQTQQRLAAFRKKYPSSSKALAVSGFPADSQS